MLAARDPSPLAFRGWFCSACGRAHTREETAPCSKAHMSARQEPPPRALIVFAESVSDALEGKPEHAHIHALAREGSCGFVALRSDSVEGQCTASQVVAQLLGAAEGQVIGDRFQGMRVVVLSDDEGVRDAAARAGAASQKAPAGEHVGAHIRDVLFGDAACAEAVVLHLRNDQPGHTADAADAVLAHLDADPDAKGALYTVLLLGIAGGMSHTPHPLSSLPPHLAHLRPRQSHEPPVPPGEPPVRTIDRALMCIHRLDCCVRVDSAKWATQGEVAARGARGTILAEHLLSEVAYKLGRAAKFGA